MGLDSKKRNSRASLLLVCLTIGAMLAFNVYQELRLSDLEALQKTSEACQIVMQDQLSIQSAKQFLENSRRFSTIIVFPDADQQVNILSFTIERPQGFALADHSIIGSITYKNGKPAYWSAVIKNEGMF